MTLQKQYHDIARLKSRRQLNVQEQNALAEHAIRQEASYWRDHPLPGVLYEAGSQRGIDWEHSIIINLDIDFPGMPALFGSLFSQDERFIRFAIDTDPLQEQLCSVEEWCDVTNEVNFSEHNRGIGAGFGAMMIRIRRQLCVAGDGQGQV